MRRRSRQGQVILEELKRLRTHPRSDELFEVVRSRLPRVSLATVYRQLGQLTGEGLALEIYCGDFVRYDGNVLPHDHLLCRRCRRVWDCDCAPLDSGAAPEGGESGFLVEGHFTVYYGLCRDCGAAAHEDIWRGGNA